MASEMEKVEASGLKEAVERARAEYRILAAGVYIPLRRTRLEL